MKTKRITLSTATFLIAVILCSFTGTTSTTKSEVIHIKSLNKFALTYNYTLGVNSFSTTYEYRDKNGVVRYQFVPAGETRPVCAQEGSVTGGIFFKGSAC